MADVVEGTPECTDRISLRGYFPLGPTSGGLLTWRNTLFPQTPLTEEGLRKQAGDFGRRVNAYASKHKVALRYFGVGEKNKHAEAQRFPPRIRVPRGVAIFVRKHGAGGKRKTQEGKVVLRRPKSWALVNHYHFHIIDPEWGHVTMRMSGHPPLGVLISLNGHEWVKRQAQKQGILWVKQSKCFVGGSDLAKINGVAERLDGKQGLARLGEVVDRWIYWACLCFALKLEQQKRSEFRYAYSCYQLEYSRNLLFKSGRQLDEIYQGLIDRTRRVLEVPRLKTIFGCKNRPSRTRKHDGRLEKIIEGSVYDLTVFKVHFGKLTLKMYDKGDRVLRVEVIVNNIEELRCGKRLEKLPGMLERLEAMVVRFLEVVQAAHLSFVDGQQFDTLAVPSVRGDRRRAGVDLQKPRMRAVAEAVTALAAQPQGFSAADLAQRLRAQKGRAMASYGPRKAAYDLHKLRGKSTSWSNICFVLGCGSAARR